MESTDKKKKRIGHGKRAIFSGRQPSREQNIQENVCQRKEPLIRYGPRATGNPLQILAFFDHPVLLLQRLSSRAFEPVRLFVIAAVVIIIVVLFDVIEHDAEDARAHATQDLPRSTHEFTR